MQVWKTVDREYSNILIQQDVESKGEQLITRLRWHFGSCGFGERVFEGKIATLNTTVKIKNSLLGICLGMQWL